MLHVPEGAETVELCDCFPGTMQPCAPGKMSGGRRGKEGGGGGRQTDRKKISTTMTTITV